MKEKLKYLPVHLILALPILGISFMVLQNLIGLDNLQTSLLSILAYFYDALLQTKIDYLEDEIKKIKK